MHKCFWKFKPFFTNLILKINSFIIVIIFIKNKKLKISFIYFLTYLWIQGYFKLNGFYLNFYAKDYP